MLSVTDLHCYYGESHIIQGVSCHADAGEFLAIVGRNGAGKSTFLNGLMGFVAARSGRIELDGVDVTAAPPYRRAAAGLALVPQGRRVFPTLTVEEHLRVPRLARTGKGQRWTTERVLELFPRLKERLGNRGTELSGGEQQMLAIARALMQSPSVLLLDEPTEGLAPLIVREVAQVLRRLAETGLAIILVEQNIAFAASIAQSVTVMSRGTITETVTAEQAQTDADFQRRCLVA